MKKTKEILLLLMSMIFLHQGIIAQGNYDLHFQPGKYVKRTAKINGKTIKYRAYLHVVYVSKPVDTTYECMNIFIPEAYFKKNKSINGYTAQTAPIFFPNSVGGYMPGAPSDPEKGFGPMGAFPGTDKTKKSSDQGTAMMGGDRHGMGGDRPGMGGGFGKGGFPGGGFPGGEKGNKNGGMPDGMGEKREDATLVALSKGYVVAAPGARGRTTKDASGNFNGKAPACIVDLKAAIRYLRYNDKVMQGDAEKIISNGTSAGGALSALLGASGNNADYEPYLKAIGAAEERDDIFAVSAYCPITNLDHADAAYEWLLNGVNNYTALKISSLTDFHIQREEVKGTLTDKQKELSEKLKEQFPAYVNSLHLKAADGTELTLDDSGNGTFKDYLLKNVIASAQAQIDKGINLSDRKWLTIEYGKVTGIDFPAYVQYMGRLKTPPAFDGVNLENAENSLFGTATLSGQHFTQFGLDNSEQQNTTLADAQIIKMMNPMNYIGTEGTTTTKHWRIRHGSKDRDGSLAVPFILATTLQNKGYDVNLFFPWDRGHAGDYDLDELFQWTDQVCK